MNWKNFIKPTKEKIILFILFLLVNTFVPLTPFFMVLKACLNPPCPNTILTFGSYVAESFLASLIFFPINLIILIINLVFWYLISCLIIFAFNRFKDKKK